MGPLGALGPQRTAGRRWLVAAAAACVLFTGAGIGWYAHQAPNPAPAVAAASGTGTPRSGLPTVALSALPPEAGAVLALVDKGGPFPYPQDGTVFSNAQHLLPARPRGYYHEYTVPTPGADTRGARRLVVGTAGDVFYTADHYVTFRQVLR